MAGLCGQTHIIMVIMCLDCKADEFCLLTVAFAYNIMLYIVYGTQKTNGNANEVTMGRYD